MELRSRDINQLRMRAKGAGTWAITRAGYQLGSGTVIRIANDTETMADMTEREVNYRADIQIELKGTGKIGAYKSFRVAAAGTIVDSIAAASATSYGGMRGGSNPVLSVEATEDHRFFPVFRGVTFSHNVLLYDVDNHPALVALNGRVDVAYERVDGTFLIVNNVWMRAQLDPEHEGGLSVRVRLNGAGAGDYTAAARRAQGLFTLDPQDTDHAALLTLMLSASAVEAEITTLDGNVINLPEFGFVIEPILGTGAVLEGTMVRGVAMGITEGTVLTVSPSLGS